MHPISPPDRQPARNAAAFTARDLEPMLRNPRAPLSVVHDPATRRVGVSRSLEFGALADTQYDVLGTLPGVYPEWLGDRSFCEVHGVRFPYIAGAMANGITSPAMVIAMGRAGMLGFLGAAGLPMDRLQASLSEISAGLPDGAVWGTNLIHTPHEPELEARVVELYLQHGARRVSASAFMGLSLPLVRFAATGLERDGSGRVRRRNHVFAKISRPEVARHFLSPAPVAMIQQLVQRGQLTAAEAELAAAVPVAEDVTVEADSGGHTDNRPLSVAFPAVAQLRDELALQYRYEQPPRVGAAGGLGTPNAVASAFSLGAAYVLTGSVNQTCVESGLSNVGKALLARATMADTTMAPCADMFEMGVQVQVLKRGTFFPARAQRLYEIYQRYDALEQIPAADRRELEEKVFRAPLQEIWARVEAFFQSRDPAQLQRAARDAKHRMALVFRWYLGMSSKWPVTGEADRQSDFQIWCGPALGAFQQWVVGTALEPLQNRTVVQVALNLLEGAAQVTRAHQLRSYGVPVPAAAFRPQPRILR